MAWPSSGDVDITKFDQDSDKISLSRPELYKMAGYVNDMIDVGPSGTLTFSTVNADGTNLVADSSTDTLNIVAGTNVTITGNASTDTLTISASGSAGNTFSTVNADGTNLVADSTTDTLNIVAGTNITITGNATTDTLTISASSGSTSKIAGSVSDGTAGTSSEVASKSVLIPSGTFTAGDVVEVYHQWNTSGNDSFYGNVWINTTAVVGGVNIDSNLLNSATAKHARLRTSVDVIAQNGNTRGFLGGPSASQVGTVYEGSGFGQDGFENSPAYHNINWAVNQYIVFGARNSSGSGSTNLKCVGYQVYKK